MLAILQKLWWVLGLLGVIWTLQVLNLLSGYGLNDWFGLIPRRLSGLDGVVFMPVLHGSFSHALSNSLPLAVLGSLLALTAARQALTVSAVIVAVGGIGVWIFGATAVHIGASGLIFGWFGYLLARGLIERDPLPLLVTLFVALVYGTMVFGVLPGQPGVSWESHLFGALAGVLAAYLFRDRLTT